MGTEGTKRVPRSLQGASKGHPDDQETGGAHPEDQEKGGGHPDAQETGGRKVPTRLVTPKGVGGFCQFSDSDILGFSQRFGYGLVWAFADFHSCRVQDCFLRRRSVRSRYVVTPHF